MSFFRLSRVLVLFVAVAVSPAILPAPAFADDADMEWEGIVTDADATQTVGYATTVYPMIFPHLAGETTGYSDTFGACRGTGCSRSHQGIDIMAPKMVPIVAVASGTVGWMHDEQGGDCCAMALYHDDGWESWYIHMNNDTPGTDDGQGWGFADGIETGAHVEAGQHIGWVGDSGNAEGTGPHTHFELHDPNGAVINPYESLLAATVIFEPYVSGDPAGCDFDADDYDDLVIGIPYEDHGARIDDGAVVVVPGSAAGPDPSASELWMQKTPGVRSAPESDDRFGTATACGDFDGDGFDDLVVGVPGEDQVKLNAGAINVLNGSASGLEARARNLWHQDRGGVPDKNNVWDEFGASLAVGDFDGDSFDDVAVGAPGEKVAGLREAGMVLVFHGDASGFGGGGVTKWTQGTAATVGSASQGDRFGAALAAADFNGDGYSDLAVGAPGEDFAVTDTGMVTVLFGGEAGLVAATSNRLVQGSGGLDGLQSEGEGFGSALAAADFDGDGHADLVVGSPGQDVADVVDAGAVHVIPGSSGGFATAGDWIISAGDATLPLQPGLRLGASLVAAGFTPDGYRDLAIGMPGHDDAAGAVATMPGSSSGLLTGATVVHTQNSRGVWNRAAPGDGFGTWLSSGDFSGLGAAWLVVGAPGEDLAGKADAGGVHVLPGGLGGVSGIGSSFLKQSTPGIPGANGPGDEFGHLAVVGP
jgi:hypothetical protein